MESSLFTLLFNPERETCVRAFELSIADSRRGGLSLQRTRKTSKGGVWWNCGRTRGWPFKALRQSSPPSPVLLCCAARRTAMHNSSLQLTDICGDNRCGFNTETAPEPFTKFHSEMIDSARYRETGRRISPIVGRSAIEETRPSQQYCRRDSAGDFEIVDNAVGATRQNKQRFACEWTTTQWGVMLFIVTFSCSSCQHPVAAVSSDFPVRGLYIIEDDLLSSPSSSFILYKDIVWQLQLYKSRKIQYYNVQSCNTLL